MEEDENLLLGKINQSESESIKRNKMKPVQKHKAMETRQSSGGEIQGALKRPPVCLRTGQNYEKCLSQLC